MKRCVVVILNWNGEGHLRRFLEGTLRCSAEADVAVADNGSTDGSVEYVESNFPMVRLIRFAENYGFAEGYNRAIAELEGYEYVVLLNSDVEVENGWLQPLLAQLDEDDTIAAVGPKILDLHRRDSFEYAGAAGGYIDYLGYPFCRGRLLNCCERDEGQYDDVRELFWVSGAAMCCRRSVFMELGGFCGEFFAHQEEIDLCWRMQLSGYRVVVVPKSRVWHLGGGTLQKSSARKVYFNHRNNLAMLLRCATPVQRVVVCVLRPLLDGAAALSYLLGGDVKAMMAVGRAYRDFFGMHRRLQQQRNAIRQHGVTESKYIYRGSIVLRYLFGRRFFKNLM